eukprot:5719835-Pyramimonas_sp.AAC.1
MSATQAVGHADVDNFRFKLLAARLLHAAHDASLDDLASTGRGRLLRTTHPIGPRPWYMPHPLLPLVTGLLRTTASPLALRSERAVTLSASLPV